MKADCDSVIGAGGGGDGVDSKRVKLFGSEELVDVVLWQTTLFLAVLTYYVGF